MTQLRDNLYFKTNRTCQKQLVITINKSSIKVRHVIISFLSICKKKNKACYITHAKWRNYWLRDDYFDEYLFPVRNNRRATEMEEERIKIKLHTMATKMKYYCKLYSSRRKVIYISVRSKEIICIFKELR